MQDTLAIVAMVVGLTAAVLVNGAIVLSLRRWCKAEHSDGDVSA